jgi:hypothetical protein
MQDFLNRKSMVRNFVIGLWTPCNLMIARDQFLVQLGAGEVKDFRPDPRSSLVVLDGLFCCDDFMEDYENDQFSNAMQNSFFKLSEL